PWRAGPASGRLMLPFGNSRSDPGGPNRERVMRAPAVILRLASLIVALAFSCAAAHAQGSRTFVSANGSDANTCDVITSPCKTWASAITKTTPGGEIDALDVGGFGTVTINKSVSLYAGPSPAGILSSNTNGIVIAADPHDVVNLRGLVVNGLNA